MKEPVSRAERIEDARSRVAVKRAVRTLGLDDGALLVIALDVAVPLWIDKLRPLTWQERAARAHACAQVIAEHGDAILYKVPGQTAEAFNRLAEGIACLAFAPGGVKIFGRHFNARTPV